MGRITALIRGQSVRTRARRILAACSGALAVLLLAGCATSPPQNVDNLCEIFREKDGWFDAMADAEKKYGAPIPIMMAIMRQESTFVEDARPPKRYVLGIIPWGRLSDAYGYAQVKEATWNWYLQRTDQSGKDRDDFDDAADFIGWYMTETRRQNGVALTDARNQYLAYHEGHGGFARGSYRAKAWLVNVSKRVERTSARYAAQLSSCRDELEDPWWWPF